jgi:hypothetical protein
MSKDISELTQEEIVKVCSSMCGACAELAFTGVCLHEHDKEVPSRERTSVRNAITTSMIVRPKHGPTKEG